jgi:sigma-54 specific flagellar transcriptional regulator A
MRKALLPEHPCAAWVALKSLTKVKLLRVLQERKVDRVGGNESVKVDVRIIAATNKTLEKLIQENRFREDLFYRLNVFPIQMPSLKERADDIPALIDFHLDRILQRLQHKIIFTSEATTLLCRYNWPGNIRELENFLERMVVIHRDAVLDAKDLDPVYRQETTTISITPATGSFNFKEYIANMERHAIELALQHSNGLVDAAAKYLSLAPQKLLEKMRKYSLISRSETP